MERKKMEKIISQPGLLLRPNGELAVRGWSPQPLLDSNLEYVNFYKLKFLQSLRLKRWDYYGLTTKTHYFSFTISDIGYLGMVFAYVIDFENKVMHEETLALPFAAGVKIARNSTEGVTEYQNKNVKLRFTTSNDQRKLSIAWQNFHQSKDLNAELELSLPSEHESMNLVIPIETRRFYFNRKINCLPAKGMVEYLGEKYEITSDTALGNLDWGRGVWAYDSFWVWASASGFTKDHQTIGLNMGYGFGDTSAASENAFILNGKIHKIGKLEFHYDSKDFMQPWSMESEDQRLNLRFTPFLDRPAKTDIKILYSEVHQMFGKYTGTLITDEGKTIEIQDLIGFAEEHHARW
jgi:hypothetical protein